MLSIEKKKIFTWDFGLNVNNVLDIAVAGINLFYLPYNRPTRTSCHIGNVHFISKSANHNLRNVYEPRKIEYQSLYIRNHIKKLAFFWLIHESNLCCRESMSAA